MSYAAKSRAWSFTAWCDKLEDPLEDIPVTQWVNVAGFKFVIFQKERCPSTGREHYQGYLFYSGHNGLTLTGVFKRLPWLLGSSACHLEPARGSVKDNVAYCSKEESKVAGPWTFGEEPAVGRPKAKHSVEDAVAALEECGYDVSVLAQSQPILFAKFHRQVEALAARVQPKPQVDFSQPRPWQKDVLDLVESDPDSRSVNWFIDPEGGQGKTYLSKYLVSEKSAFYCTGGRHQDILHAYNNQRIIIFDFTRDKADMVAYNVIEMLKNGMFFSGKYNSTTKARIGDAHVIVFSNFEPDRSKLSADRWKIKYLSGPMVSQVDSVAQALLGV